MTSPVAQWFVGVDIAAATFTAALPAAQRGRLGTFDQTPAGFTLFQEQLRATVVPAQTLIVMEATGSYWVALAVALHEAGYQVSVVNPKVIYNYARTLSRRSKTDALDAQVIQQFASERQPAAWTPPPVVYHELRQRLVARDSLVEMRQQIRNQHHALAQWPVKVASVLTQFTTLEADLDTRIRAVEQEINAWLQDGAWAASATVLATIPGVGPLTSAWLLVATLNFALCASPEEAVAYAGLNPLTYESGTSVRGRTRIGRGGHARLRRALYLASLSAVRYNPLIKPFYERLRANGKPVKVARCAAARKLVHLAWAVVTKQQPFDPTYSGRMIRP